MLNDNLTYSISEEVFSQFPGYHRGVVLAFGITISESPPELIQLLRTEETSLQQRLSIDSLLDNDRILSWREAYRQFGAKPSKFRPSMEAMTRRVLKGDNLPSINTLVDIGNVISLRHLLPAGGHAIDVLKEDISLCVAKGDELFIPFGSEEKENPLPGEIIFTEGKTVLTRRWTWRQANHTLIESSTKDIEFNVDGLPPVPLSEVEQTCIEIMDLIKQFCGGECRYEILSEDKPQISLTR